MALIRCIATDRPGARYVDSALLMFLLIGMVAGSKGPGGIYFDDAAVAKFVGTLACARISARSHRGC